MVRRRKFRKVARDGFDDSYRMREINKQMSPLQQQLDLTLCVLVKHASYQARNPTQNPMARVEMSLSLALVAAVALVTDLEVECEVGSEIAVV